MVTRTQKALLRGLSFTHELYNIAAPTNWNSNITNNQLENLINLFYLLLERQTQTNLI
jgi:hypothetical protein